MSRKRTTQAVELRQCSRCERPKADWRICPLCKLTYCSPCFYSHFAYCHTLVKKELK
jgi:hypothetical protein